MKDHIIEIAKILKANNEGLSLEKHIQFLEKTCTEMEILIGNRCQDKNVVPSILGYIANHHTFDITSHEKTKNIIDTIMELICPMAEDDERSLFILEYLKENTGKRLNAF